MSNNKRKRNGSPLDRTIFSLWFGENEDSSDLQESEYKWFEKTEDPNRPRRGGGKFSEKHDHFYQCQSLAFLFSKGKEIEQQFRLLKLMKGLYRHPEISVGCSNGVVSIDLEAARNFISIAFDLQCKMDEYATFRFKPSTNIDICELVKQQSSISVFSRHHISLRNACSVEEGIDLHVGVDDLTIKALVDPREMLKPEVIGKMQEDIEALNDQLEEENSKSDRWTIRDNLHNLLDSDFRRILRRAGIVAENSDVFEELRGILMVYFEKMITDVISYCGRVRTYSIITADDVLASRPFGSRLLGFGGPLGIRNVWSTMVQKVLKKVHPECSLGPKALSVMNDIISFLMEEVLDKARIFAMKKYLHPKGPQDERDDDDIGNDLGAVGVKTFYAYNQPGKIYTGDYDNLTSGGYTEIKDTISMISSKEIQAACKLVYSGDLSRRAVSEGTKAVTNYFQSENNNSTFSSSITKESVGSCCGLQFSPEVVALVASRMTNGFPMSEYTAVYLAAILEYMTEEILDLSGKVSQDKGTSLIGSRHLKLIIDNDEDLIKTFKNCVIREGGVYPFFHSILLPEGVEYKIVSKFEELMVAKALAAARASNSSCAVFVDPRTGLHMGVTNKNKNSIFPLPQLDELSKQGQEERRRLAQGQLSKEEAKVMKTEGYGAFKDQNDRVNEDGWKSESLQRIHARRLQEIKREQSLTDLIFSPSAFENFAEEMFQNCGHFLYTQEAMEAMQTFLEAYLVELCQEANLTAIHAGRVSVCPKDFHLTRRIRHERF